MDIGDNGGEIGFGTEPERPHTALPDDLPRSLDDRRPAHYTAETEMYDAWQGQNCDLSTTESMESNPVIGQSQFLTAPVLAKPLQFNSLSLDTNDYEPAPKIDDSDARLMEMLAAQAAHRDDGSAIEDEEAVAANESLSDAKKKEILQKALNMAASNGDVCQSRGSFERRGD